ncbi:MAG: hypothetical protein RLW61_15870 [Gammaproteobacteria bacterium]
MNDTAGAAAKAASRQARRRGVGAGLLLGFALLTATATGCPVVANPARTVLALHDTGAQDKPSPALVIGMLPADEATALAAAAGLAPAHAAVVRVGAQTMSALLAMCRDGDLEYRRATPPYPPSGFVLTLIDAAGTYRTPALTRTSARRVVARARAELAPSSADYAALTVMMQAVAGE